MKTQQNDQGEGYGQPIFPGCKEKAEGVLLPKVSSPFQHSLSEFVVLLGTTADFSRLAPGIPFSLETVF